MDIFGRVSWNGYFDHVRPLQILDTTHDNPNRRSYYVDISIVVINGSSNGFGKWKYKGDKVPIGFLNGKKEIR